MLLPLAQCWQRVVTNTIFAPTNEAMAKYITNLLGEGKTVDDLSLEQAQRIAYSCVIDNGSEAAYDSPNFGNYVNGAFPKGDLNKPFDNPEAAHG